MIKDHKLLFKQFNNIFKSFNPFEKELILYKYFVNLPSKHNAALSKLAFPKDINVLIDYFESLQILISIKEQGIIFTPKFIADFMVKDCIKIFDKNILDPACGCGVFLISAIDHLIQNGVSPRAAFNLVYGIDVNQDNVRRCKLVLQIYAHQFGIKDFTADNILCHDSLKTNYADLFKVNNFFYIVGNPPYVNSHKLPLEQSLFLKTQFSTTQSGTANIFYAFIEHSLKILDPDGKLVFIVPNNFLTISSAKNLRDFIFKANCLEKIIDFGCNMVFLPVRTYSCILFLSLKRKNHFNVLNLKPSKQIKNILTQADLKSFVLNQNVLSYPKWMLKSDLISSNIEKIKNQKIKLGKYIHTGIATLNDDLFIINYDPVTDCYYKKVNNQLFYFEKSLIKYLYKIPELKNSVSIKKYILFPYRYNQIHNRYEIIKENELKIQFPKTYNYLIAVHAELIKRDHGKTNSVAWYAYGRSQGLNFSENKILFPTFAGTPNFKVIKDHSLFCNGSAITNFPENIISLDVLCRILNSQIMSYYISNISYPIQGNYFCYQKKYLESFSVPEFSIYEQFLILRASNEELNRFLIKKYGLKIDKS